jgi:hypothetical protein
MALPTVRGKRKLIGTLGAVAAVQGMLSIECGSLKQGGPLPKTGERAAIILRGFFDL